LLKDRGVLEDTLKREARQVDASKLASGQQLSHRAARSGRLLESMARETVTQHQVGDIWVVANNCIL